MGTHYCPEKTWYQEKLWIMIFIVLVVMGASFFIPLLEPVYDAFMDYFKLIWWAILLGLFLGGVIDYFVPDEYIAHILARKGKKSIFNATILGFVMSGCSHGILAIAMQLYKKGASVPAVIAFLLASPWANISITILLFGFFGLKAFFLVLAAIVIAIITGFAYQLLDRFNMIERAKPVRLLKNFSIGKDMKQRWKKVKCDGNFFVCAVKGVSHGAWDLAKMVMWWIFFGMLLAAFARAFVPVHFFHNYMGATFVGIAVTLFVATIIEVCSEGSSPIAFEIFNQTGAFGNSFVFLMAGVVTDYTEIGLIWSNIGKKAALWLPVITVPQVILVGYLFNIFL